MKFFKNSLVFVFFITIFLGSCHKLGSSPSGSGGSSKPYLYALKISGEDNKIVQCSMENYLDCKDAGFSSNSLVSDEKPKSLFNLNQESFGFISNKNEKAFICSFLDKKCVSVDFQGMASFISFTVNQNFIFLFNVIDIQNPLVRCELNGKKCTSLRITEFVGSKGNASPELTIVNDKLMVTDISNNLLECDSAGTSCKKVFTGLSAAFSNVIGARGQLFANVSINNKDGVHKCDVKTGKCVSSDSMLKGMLKQEFFGSNLYVYLMTENILYKCDENGNNCKNIFGKIPADLKLESGFIVK